VGVPNHRVNAAFGARTWEKYIVSVGLNKTERPENIEEKTFQRLYAKIDFDTIQDGVELGNIDGMSGGPIFGVKVLDDRFDYKLIGIQSGWNQNDTIIACGAQPFIDAIKAIPEN